MNKRYEEMDAAALREALIACEAEKLAVQQADQAKTEFLAQMSHEIRTPMNAVIGIAHILSASSPLTDRQRDCVNTLKTSANGLMALIDDMLDLAKIESGNLQMEAISFDLGELIQNTISMMGGKAAEKNIILNFDADNLTERWFIGDPNRIRQVMLNLCSNALKFTQAGRIDFTAQSAGSGDARSITLSVRDTGIGIAPDKLDAVFEKFVQADNAIARKYGGTGLGLAITKMLTEAMGGEIRVESEVGKGSEFTVTFTLPVAREAKRA